MIVALLLSIVLTAGAVWYWLTLQKPMAYKRAERGIVTARATTNSVKRQPLKNALAHKVVARNHASHSYHAVAVQCKNGACASAKEIARTRFLTQAAPVLPLPSCDAAHCECGYAHFQDRRTEDDNRRSGHGLQTELYPQTAGRERRQEHGRRKTD